jgi:Cu-Zn family superoxide dismutase
MPAFAACRTTFLAITGAALIALVTTQAVAQQARAVLHAPDGASVGTVGLTETPHGVLLAVTLDRAPTGAHAFHIHAVGACAAPDFSSAGGHFNPAGHRHGISNPAGKHAGDLPNIHVGADGTLRVEVLAEAVSLTAGGSRASLFDGDGSAIVIHTGADDYASDPAGNAGPRIACGVVEPAG